ncbi:MAG: hypothetical protein HY686_00125 [Chloroflexi bacterium]|nr:hypothetical protein [Chloroflexota bacterium]
MVTQTRVEPEGVSLTAPSRSTLALRPFQLSLALTAGSLALLSYSLLQMELRLDNLGIISSYPLTFFASLALLTLAAAALWTRPGNWGWLAGLHFLILVFALYFTPVILDGVPRPRWSFIYFGWTQYILDNGTLRPDQFTYHNWPGLFLLTTALMKVTGISDPIPVMTLFHMVIPLLFALPLYLLCKRVGWTGTFFWTLLWVFTVANWLDQSNYQPQGLALFLFLLFFALLIQEDRAAASPRAGKYLFLATIVFAALTITHFATPFVATAAAGVLALARRRLGHGPPLPYVLLMLVIFLSWAVYGSQYLFIRAVPDHLRLLFRIDLFFRTNLLSRVEGRGAQQIVIELKLLFFALTALLAGAGLLLSLWRQHRRDMDPTLFILAGAPLAMIAFPVYLGEDLTRIFLLMLAPLAYFIAKLTRSWWTYPLLIGFLLVAIPLHFITHYGGDLNDSMTRNEWLAGASFYRITNGGDVVGGLPLGKSQGIERYGSIPLYEVKLQGNELRYPGGGPDPWQTQYIALGAGDIQPQQVFFKQPSYLEDALSNSPYYNRSYISPALVIYSHIPLAATR